MDFDIAKELMKKMIQDQFPSLDPARASELADIWSWQFSRIIRLMLDCVAQETGICHEIFKDEAILELAMRIDPIAKLIVSKNLEGREPDKIDIQEEWQTVRSDSGLKKLENTARVFVQVFWEPLMEKWQASTQLLEQGKISTLETVRTGPLIIIPGDERKNRTIKNHFDSSFANKLWTNDANKNKVKILSRRVDGNIKSEIKYSNEWGFEQYLWSQSLEDFFSTIENEVAKPDGVYMKLIEGRALMRQIDEHKWTVFLIIQMLRTPAFIVRNMTVLKKWLENHPKYIHLLWMTHPSYLRKVYEESLFGPNFCTNSLYRDIFQRDWMIWKAANGHYFVKSDNPVTLIKNGAISGFLYPLSPTKCFVASILPRDQKPVLRVKEIPLSPELTLGVSVAIAHYADYSVMTCLENNDPELEVVLRQWLGNHKLDEPFPYRLMEPYWGSMKPKEQPRPRGKRTR